MNPISEQRLRWYEAASNGRLPTGEREVVKVRSDELQYALACVRAVEAVREWAEEYGSQRGAGMLVLKVINQHLGDQS